MVATVVTSGRKYIDIDAYAGVIVYRELLRVTEEEPILAISTAPLNQSIPPKLRNTKYHLDALDLLPENCNYIVVDVSNSDFFDPIVKPERIIGIIDHHTGYETFWQEKLGKAAEIEFIGSVCTVIYEKIKSCGKESILDQELCQLLTAGILDNTLNLKSNITTERDRQAYDELVKIGGLDENWRREYFELCFAEISNNLERAITDDTKIEFVSESLPKVFGQIVLPSHAEFDVQILPRIFRPYDEWMMNVISLDDGKSYIYYSGKDMESTKRKLERLLGTPAYNSLIVLDKFKLRKEIMDQARRFSS